MSSSIMFSNSLKSSITANQPVFMLADGLPTKPSVGGGKYFGVHPVSKVHYKLPARFMPAKLVHFDTPKDENAPARLVIPGKEEDIIKHVGSINSTFMLLLMLAHPDEGMCSVFVMKDAVVAYHSKNGKPSKKASDIPGKETGLHDLHNIHIANNEQYLGKNAGKYYWLNINISDSIELQLFIRDDANETTVISIHKGIHEKHEELVSFSDLTGPGLASTVEFVEDKASVAINGIVKALTDVNKLAIAENKGPIRRTQLRLWFKQRTLRVLLDNVIVGQSLYDSSLLPFSTAVFAFNLSNTTQYLSSVSIFVQFSSQQCN
ncbi:hypothetical protein BC830DRAFT_1085050 [Chytriomyces sp. MP71]|nr:hypothetical protein BC830DRAFT_1085050 [Chytriomyces sp. MP71]